MKISPTIIFFGSSSDSLLVLKKLAEEQYPVVAVVTQPPRPIGRKHILTQTPTQVFATEHHIPVLAFATSNEKSFLYENEDAVINTLATFKADLLISASYGQKIPTKTIAEAKHGGLNVHPSLLPRWRGADPIPWTILSGDHQTGVTVVTLTEKMDEGKIIAQKKIPVTPHDEHIPLREKLFTLGADLLIDSLPDYVSGDTTGQIQNPEHATVARRLSRDDGFVPWGVIEKATKGESVLSEKLSPFLQQFTLSTASNAAEAASNAAEAASNAAEAASNAAEAASNAAEAASNAAEASPFNHSILIDRAVRALSPWPGVWTEIIVNRQSSIADHEKKRLKILKTHISSTQPKLVIDEVQLEGEKPRQLKSLTELGL